MFVLVPFFGAAVVAALLFFVVKKRFFGREACNTLNDVDKDTVILHQLNRGPHAPSISPFCIKLETYLRMANIKYKNVHSRQRSSKGKVPWIELNGESIPDTNFIINRLNKKFDVNLNKELSSKDQAMSRAFVKLVEENLYWCLVMYRWVFRVNEAWLEEAGIPKIFRWYVSRLASKQSYEHGLGRHSQSEVDQIMEDDLRAISEQLGYKEFMMGHEPTELDCSLFGLLAQFKWNLHSSLASKLVNEDFANLSRYCDRMKNKFWPDWNACITQGEQLKE